VFRKCFQHRQVKDRAARRDENDLLIFFSATTYKARPYYKP